MQETKQTFVADQFKLSFERFDARNLDVFLHKQAPVLRLSSELSHFEGTVA